MPAVMAMAKAPQKVTRRAARHGSAPPALAPTMPRIAKNPKDAADTAKGKDGPGTSAAITSGIAAPAVKVAAEVKAA